LSDEVKLEDRGSDTEERGARKPVLMETNYSVSGHGRGRPSEERKASRAGTPSLPYLKEVASGKKVANRKRKKEAEGSKKGDRK